MMTSCQLQANTLVGYQAKFSMEGSWSTQSHKLVSVIKSVQREASQFCTYNPY